jgi:hypothetical protein
LQFYLAIADAMLVARGEPAAKAQSIPEVTP